jgi:hypothetical protein
MNNKKDKIKFKITNSIIGKRKLYWRISMFSIDIDEIIDNISICLYEYNVDKHQWQKPIYKLNSDNLNQKVYGNYCYIDRLSKKKLSRLISKWNNHNVVYICEQIFAKGYMEIYTK